MREGKILHIEIFLLKSEEMPPTGTLWGIPLTEVAWRGNHMGLDAEGRLLFRTAAAAEMHPHSTGN